LVGALRGRVWSHVLFLSSWWLHWDGTCTKMRPPPAWVPEEPQLFTSPDMQWEWEMVQLLTLWACLLLGHNLTCPDTT
jgi:hypothetical protein